jgi:carboxyl-terminal processing protease
MLSPDEVYTEGIANETVPSIKVALDTLGYEIEDFDEDFGPDLTTAVGDFQSDNGLEMTGNVTGETSTILMSELREYINENDAQLEYLVDYINGEYTEEEIEEYAESRAQYLEIELPEEETEEGEPSEGQDEEQEEESTEEPVDEASPEEESTEE